MKKVHLLGGALIIVVLVAAIAFALMTGQKSPVYVAGEISVDQSLISDTYATNTIFIILFDDSINKRMPFGVVKYNVPTPLTNNKMSFIVTPDNIQQMFPGNITPKNFRVKVRFDTDGLAGPDKDGDLVGELENIAYGTRQIQILVDKKITL